MPAIYNRLVRQNLFDWSAHDHEVAHEMGINALRFLGSDLIYPILSAITSPHPSLEREVWGIKFPSPLGLAAGLDKDGRAVHGLAALGFGFVEIGTIVPRPQTGNDRPRMFRLEKDRALINRLGFNSDGMYKVLSNLSRRSLPPIPIGINAGANKETILKKRGVADDYSAVIRTMRSFGDYLTVNISSPNTPGLRGLQEKEPLLELLQVVQRLLKDLAETNRKMKKKPVVVKVAPDLNFPELDDVLDVIMQTGVEGICIGNTTLSRPTWLKSYDSGQVGGLSGQPLFNRTRELVRYVNHRVPNLPIMAAGGISEWRGASWLLEVDGASLIQILTAFIYEGPFLPMRMNRGMVRFMRLREPAKVEAKMA